MIALSLLFYLALMILLLLTIIELTIMTLGGLFNLIIYPTTICVVCGTLGIGVGFWIYKVGVIIHELICML
jgi:hypothetical protein